MNAKFAVKFCHMPRMPLTMYFQDTWIERVATSVHSVIKLEQEILSANM